MMRHFQEQKKVAKLKYPDGVSALFFFS